MDGVDARSRWKNLKQRLGFKGMGCCGASWAFSASNMAPRDDDQLEDEASMGVGQIPAANATTPGACAARMPATSMMNLGTALAAERNSRAVRGWRGRPLGPTNGASTGPVMSLMRLMEETDGEDDRKRKEKEKGSDGVCCVCMARNKGAAFIPCGHTFCRVCSRELWLNRGSCPICKRSILEILDIF